MKWNEIEINYTNQLEALRKMTPYERLGIEHGATIQEAKKAYRKKISLYHPDKTHSFMTDHGEEISKLLNQAVEQIRTELEQ